MINAEVKSYCERIVRLEQERKTLAADVADIKKEAADKGYDKALLNKVVQLMLKDDAKRIKALEQHELFDTYLIAAGLLAETETAPNSGGPAEGSTETPLKTTDPSAQPIQDTQPLNPVAEASAGVEAENSMPAPIATAVDDEPAGQRGGDAPSSPPDNYTLAVSMANSVQSPSTEFLRKAMNISYAEAAGYIERMEREGVISAPQANGKRAVLDADLGNIPPFLDRRKPKPEYSATELLGAG